MDEDPLPSPSHATTLSSSPLLNPRLRALSPTSSEPPLFSEDDPPEAADVTNYKSPRDKRKRAGAWWEIEPTRAPKRRLFRRNFDSGVHMMSDDSTSANLDIASDPPMLEHEEARSESREERIERVTQSMTNSEALLYRTIEKSVECNATEFNFSALELQDNELHHLHLLNQVITVPVDASVDVPAETQYRSLIPELHINLGDNQLRYLAPALFNVQHLTSLTLRSNGIEELPPHIAKLTNLSTLDLCYNSIRTLPLELLGMCSPQGNLVRLALAGNPIYLSGAGWSYWIFRKAEAILASSASTLPKVTPAQSISAFAHEDRYHPANHLPRMLRYLEKDWSDFGGHHRFAPESFNTKITMDNIKDGLFLMARTQATYLDAAGRLMKGSSAPTWDTLEETAVWIDSMGRPHSYNNPQGLMVSTSLGTDAVPDVWFNPPSMSKVPSLRNLSLTLALKHLSAEQIRSAVDGMMPAEVDHNLEAAERNMSSVFGPLRMCHCCGKQYIVPRAEWVEAWVMGGECLPFKATVCSWGCVPDVIARRPEPLRWLDVQG
ncbi:hypothetical protein N0V90_003309 [Kalmusia sp. IMI 367209]|nr:hypothetical protein N0V90_003309 [Kalmusia sp. IMI 367209]